MALCTNHTVSEPEGSIDVSVSDVTASEGATWDEISVTATVQATDDQFASSESVDVEFSISGSANDSMTESVLIAPGSTETLTVAFSDAPEGSYQACADVVK